MTDPRTALFLESIDVSHVAPADAERARLSTALQLLVDDHCADFTPVEIDAVAAAVMRLVGLTFAVRRRQAHESATDRREAA